MSIKFEGLDEVLDSLDKVGAAYNFIPALKKACALVERTAKQKAEKNTGELRRSITSKVENTNGEIVGTVYTPLEYAPYVEYGTGLYREENPKAGYWVYVKNSSGQRSGPTNRYTLEKAKEVVAYLKSKGLDATYTQGREPAPFMRPALYENRDRVLEILKEGLK